MKKTTALTLLTEAVTGLWAIADGCSNPVRRAKRSLKVMNALAHMDEPKRKTLR